MRWLSVLVAFQQALWIDVPYVRQAKNGCGSASIWMVMEYWQPGLAPRVESIQAEVYSAQAEGAVARDVEEYLRSRGFSVFTFRADWTDLEQHVSQGRPLIVCLERNARGVPLHYVVVAGIDTARGIVLVNDPAERKLLSMSRNDFELKWKAVNNWTLLAVPELELASTAFREEKFAQAAEHLNHAVRRAPFDAYANEFLGAVHFLQNNLESALKYWNRAGEPMLDNIHIDPPLAINPVLLDRAFAFSRGSMLTLEALRTTRARLDSLGVFSRHVVELAPAEGTDRFDLTLRAAERNGMELVSWFTGLPYQTFYPELFNLGGNAVNLKSMLRADSRKRRAFVSISTPIRGDPKWSFRLSFDARDELWFDPATPFRMRRAEASSEVHMTPSGRWNLTTGVSVSRRSFSNSFSRGFAVRHSTAFAGNIIRDSDRRLDAGFTLSFHAGKLFDLQRDRFAKVESGIFSKWRPFRSRDDYELSASLRAGQAFGGVPFDELYLIGLDRDSDLWSRGHWASREGVKDAALAARSFVAVNVDFQKVLTDSGIFRWSVGPFVDAAVRPSSPKWIDAGLQLRFKALGSLAFNLSYGRSLKDSNHAWFINVPK